MNNPKVFVNVDYRVINRVTGIPYTPLTTLIVEHEFVDTNVLCQGNLDLIYSDIVTKVRYQLEDLFWSVLRNDRNLRELIGGEEWIIYFNTPIKHSPMYSTRELAVNSLVLKSVWDKTDLDHESMFSNRNNTVLQSLIASVLTQFTTKQTTLSKFISFFRKHILVID